jgi:hypothetical protein
MGSPTEESWGIREMTREDAIDELCAQMAGAPNLEHYRRWLTFRSDIELSTLVGRRVVTPWKPRR